MATTGFWPVKGRLKEVIDYAENPDKTTDKRYLDKDLAATLEYAENSSKTDEKLFVTGINCSKHTAYEEMIAVKHKYGEKGKNIAYHGYQSFQEGEVTPEEAHRIGVKTARAMWGDRYQVVVTTHLNTENLHNHFVVNSVSFKDGKKFRNKIGDHMELRKISDKICAEHDKSVLTDAPFYSTDRKAYWIRKSGQFTHRDMLRDDIDRALFMSASYEAFERNLNVMGYRFVRGTEYKHPSIMAPGWQRAVRIDSLGRNYTPEAIRYRIENEASEIAYYGARIAAPRRTPMLNILNHELRKVRYMDDLSALFYLLTELLRIALDIQEQPLQDDIPLSPELRAALREFEQWTKQEDFLYTNEICTEADLISFMDKTEMKITELEKEREKVSNRIRRPKSEEDLIENKELRKQISEKIKPLRQELKMANKIFSSLPRVIELIELERQHEIATIEKTRERNYER